MNEKEQSSSEENKKPESNGPISEELYNRIPDQFKHPEDEETALFKETEKPSSEDDSNQSMIFEKPESEEPPPPPFPHKLPTSRKKPVISPFFILLLIILAVWLFISHRNRTEVTQISWTGFNEQLNVGNIESVHMKGNQITGTFVDAPKLSLPGYARLDAFLPDEQYQHGLPDRWQIIQVPVEKANRSTFGKADSPYILGVEESGKPTNVRIYRLFETEIPATAFADPLLDDIIRTKAKSFDSKTPGDNSGYYMFFSILLSLGILIIFWRMMRRTNEHMMGGGVPGFSKNPMRRYDPGGKAVKFKDVAGLDNVKKELEEVVDFLRDPTKFEKMGARVPKGTLMFGPPGTGKTLLARAVAGEAGVPFFSINGSEFMQMFVGVGATRVRELFQEAKENAPSIVFIDEIDAVGRQRGTGLGGGHDEREQTLNQILSEMDGFVQSETVMVMAATNRPDVLDPALMRPGRFDRHVTVDRPSLKGRKEILQIYLAKIPFLGEDVDVDKLAQSTVGFTGAEIQNLVNEAALWAARQNKSEVNTSDFEFAHEKIALGLVREEHITEANKRKTAYHEAGHTMLDWYCPTNTKVHKVTIVPRGRALGATYILPEEDQLNLTEKELYAKLAGYLAGREAEKIVYHQASTGAESDLKEATNLARRMVVHWGMSEKLGPVSYRAGESNPFLGREIAEMREYSEATARLIDEEVMRILRTSESDANRLLCEKRDLLDQLADALVKEEELDHDRIAEILGPCAVREE